MKWMVILVFDMIWLKVEKTSCSSWLFCKFPGERWPRFCGFISNKSWSQEAKSSLKVFERRWWVLNVLEVSKLFEILTASSVSFFSVWLGLLAFDGSWIADSWILIVSCDFCESRLIQSLVPAFGTLLWKNGRIPVMISCVNTPRLQKSTDLL